MGTSIRAPCFILPQGSGEENGCDRVAGQRSPSGVALNRSMSDKARRAGPAPARTGPAPGGAGESGSALLLLADAGVVGLRLFEADQPVPVGVDGVELLACAQPFGEGH